MSKMREFINNHLVSDELPFDARVLNFVCLFGAIASCFALISRIIARMPFLAVAPLLVMIAAILGIFLMSIKKAKHATFLTTLIVYAVSIVFWPVLFFTIGGPGSGMAVYFALAIILDFMLLKGLTRVFALVITFAVTTLCYLLTLYYGVGTLPAGGLTTYQLLVDILQSIFIVGSLVGVIIIYQTRLYQNEKSKVTTVSEEAKRSEVLLSQTQLTVSAMFEANPHINILFDSQFKLVDCNPAAVTFFGFKSKDDLLDGFIERMVKSIPAYQPDGRVSIPLPERLMKAANDGYVKFETELHVSSQVIRNLSVEFKKIPYGNSFAVVGYVYDMTEMHAREMELRSRDQQLREAVKEAETANLTKSNFLATMSHEIRTPMNAILGITEIQLQNENLDADSSEAFDKIFTSGYMLLGIINDILDLSRIEAGKLELISDKYEIASLISDTAQLNMMRIGSKPIEFELNVDEDVPTILVGDELRVKQILNNILSNAFKYTAEGTVVLTVAAEPGSVSDEDVILVFTVSDTGQGMTKEQVSKLFDEYTRFNTEINRATEGIGLGMNITRNLVRMMHGEIKVDSAPGEGTTFSVRIPQDRNGPGVLGKEMADNLHNFRTSSRAAMRRVQITREPMPYGSVLIVDDVETNIYVAKGLMAPYGLKIESADSGYAAIEKIKRGGVYDIVFMDHMMPVMDGVEATKILRSEGYDRPIVALTANAVAGQADMFLGSGFDDFISKPIDIRQLNVVLNKLIRDKQLPEVIEAARKKTEAPIERAAEEAPRPAINMHFAEVFVRDALKVLKVLEEISENGDYSNEDTMRSYIINVHGVRSALANTGQTDLAGRAAVLEKAGRGGRLEVVLEDTPAFLSSLRALTEGLIAQLEKPKDESADEDTSFLSEKLLSIKAACEQYDETAAEEILTDLRRVPHTRPTADLLNEIEERLLHSEFDEIVSGINSYMDT